MLTLLGPVAARRYHGPGWSPNGVISAYLLVTRRVLSQLETGPPGGGYHSPSWSPRGVVDITANAGHQQGVIPAQDWSSRGKVITVQAGYPAVLSQQG